MIKVSVNVSRDVSPLLRQFISDLDGPTLTDLNAASGRAAVVAAKFYHNDFQDRGKWENKSLGTHGAGRKSTGFGAQIANGWNFQRASKFRATIANSAPLYAHKVNGGTITPKRAKALTIPMIPEAHGRSAADYQIFSGNRLFTIKGKRALFERVGGEVTASRGRGRRTAGATKVKTSAIRPVYALLKSVNQRPWPGALPPSNLLAEAFAIEWEQQFTEYVEKL